MNLFPTESISFKTKLKEDEIKNQLNLLDTSTLYFVKVDGRKFIIHKIFSNRKSGLLTTIGEIQPSASGVTIQMEITLTKKVKILLIVAIIFLLTTPVLLLNAGNTGNFLLLLPIGMLLFGYMVIRLGFKMESEKTKIDLKNLFKAEITAF